MSSYKIAIAGTGYVGLSNAILLSQHNEVYAVDIIEEKVNLINSGKSPIVDKEIQEYLATKDLNLTATTDAKKGALKEIETVLSKYMMQEKRNYKTPTTPKEQQDLESEIENISENGER